MIAEAYVSFKRKVLSFEAYQEIEHVLIAIFPMPPIPEEAFEEVMNHMKNDKKNAGNSINFVLLKAPGSAEINAELSEKEIGGGLVAPFVARPKFELTKKASEEALSSN